MHVIEDRHWNLAPFLLREQTTCMENEWRSLSLALPHHPYRLSRMGPFSKKHYWSARTQEVPVRVLIKPRASFFAVRSWSPSRTFCSSSLLFLSYLLRSSSLSMSFLPTVAIALFPFPLAPPKTLLSSCSDLSDAAVVLFSHFTKDLLAARSDLLSSRRIVLSFRSTWALPNFSDQRQIQSALVHVNTHAQNHHIEM